MIRTGGLFILMRDAAEPATQARLVQVITSFEA